MLKLHGNARVDTARRHIEDALGVRVGLLLKDGTPAPPTDALSSLQVATTASGPFELPHGKTKLANVEKTLLKHFGVRVQILNADGTPADPSVTLATAAVQQRRARTNLPALSAWLRTAMVDNELTPDALATRSGLSLVTIENLYNGETQNPQPRTLALIEEAVGQKVPVAVTAEVREDNILAGIGEFKQWDDPHVFTDAEPPDTPGVYVLYSRNGGVTYVGMSKNSVRARLVSHSQKKWYEFPTVARGAYVSIADPALARAVEKLIIKVLGRRNLLVNEQDQTDQAEHGLA